jgi:hypothetical protein
MPGNQLNRSVPNVNRIKLIQRSGESVIEKKVTLQCQVLIINNAKQVPIPAESMMGKYCTHVLIAKIPFAVPNDPIEMTLSAWVERQGLNAFMTLAVPDAAFRLVQASGRLLRSETDKGQITLFDERIINRSYGKKILGSMPPYRQEIFERDVSREENI